MTELEKIEQGIAALEAQRSILGDEVVDATIAPLREKLVALRDRAITTHHGQIDKHIGDAVMAVWSAAETREDDAEQAVRAALAMQAALGELSATHGRSIRLRIGVHTGPALLGEIGSTHEFTAMGDTVNLAARLEQAAPIGEILISHATYRQVRGLFDMQRQPWLSVKGKTEPIQTYLVQRAKPRAFHMITRGVEGLETRLIGRDAELAQLQNAFNTCAAQAVPQTITIVGEAGIGKSRLMQEFLAWAELSPVMYWLFRGRATPGTVAAPYALLRDLFAFRFEIQESDTLPIARAKLERGLSTMLPDDPTVPEKAHFIGHLLGWDFSTSPYVRGLLTDPLQIRTLAVHFLTLFFGAVAQAYPVVMLLEDLHWADQSSLEALHHILGNVPPDAALLVIANTRPTLFERYADWCLVASTRLDLQPLTLPDCGALVADILRNVVQLPLELRDLIVRQADGNPFYVEELIKMLIDEQIIQASETEWSVNTDRLSTLRVPPTLFGVLQARLDSLPEAERLALQQAAVIGRIFWDTAVQSLDLNHAALAQIETSLDAAQGRELLFRHPTSAFADNREYRFKHTLLRDVAYETVLKRDRPFYHARVADWLETVCGARRKEYVAMLAQHHEQAGHIHHAAALWAEAGDQAMPVSAFADAAQFYARAVALKADVSAWWRALGEAHFRLSDFSAAQLALAQAQATATTDIDRAAALALLGEVASAVGDYAIAQRLLAEALPLAGANNDEATLCRVFYALGDVNWRLGKFDTAREALSESLALACALEDSTRELFALNRLGVVVGHHDLATGEQLHQEVYTRAMAVGNRNLAMMALNNLGEAAKARQDYPAARDYHQQALTITLAIGAQQFIALVHLNLAKDDISLGRLAVAHTGLREGLTLGLRLRAATIVVSAVMYFADLAYAEGQIDRALALLGLAQRHPAWNSDGQYEMDATLAAWALDPALVEAGLAKGAELEWETTIQELLEG